MAIAVPRARYRVLAGSKRRLSRCEPTLFKTYTLVEDHGKDNEYTALGDARSLKGAEVRGEVKMFKNAGSVGETKQGLESLQAD